MSPSRRRNAGFTLSEALVASAIFAIIAVSVFAVFVDANKVYKRGETQAEMQQRTRLAFDILMDEMRLAGFDYNRDGDANAYEDQTDEQLEYVGPHAIAFRGNFDFDDALGGRESDYEDDPTSADYGTVCCPIVTTANDEIVVYALRSDDASANTGSIELALDLSMPRDSGWDDDGVPENEETVTIDNIDLTDDNPPYTLVRFSFDDDGELVEQPAANAVRSVTFRYTGDDGSETYCLAPAADGTCPTGNGHAFDSLGGDDDLGGTVGAGRTARAAIRRFGITFVGMTEGDVRDYTDADDELMPSRPKLSLDATVVPMNLGMKGQPDLEDFDDVRPTNVSVCGGQCNLIRIDWDEVGRAAGYYVKLFLSGQTEPFFVEATPGIAIEGTDPPRVFATYNRVDHPSIVTGARIFAKVQARFAGDDTSGDSDASSLITLTDVVKPSAPEGLTATGYDPSATGWPAVDDNLIAPDTDTATLTHALENRIVVSWSAPHWALQTTDEADPLAGVTTAEGAGDAPLECDNQEEDLDGDTTIDGTFTRLRELAGTTRYLVFRSTNPRFVPTNADFVAATQGIVDGTTGRLSYIDQTIHEFMDGTFNATTNAVENCKTYYYRVRAVDDCWSGSDPASITDPHLSPFHPPLDPDPTASNSDDTTSLSPSDVSPAIPGFAVPKTPPRAPTNVRFREFDRRLDDGDGRDATIAFDAVKLDTTTATDASGQTIPAYEDVTISEYRVYSHDTDPNFTLSDAKAGINGVRLDKVIAIADLKAGRIARDDENGNGTVSASEDESVAPTTSIAQPASGLRVDLEPSTSRYYKVVAVQCANEDTSPSVSTPDANDYGSLSPAVLFPCDLGGGPYTAMTVNASSFPSSVSGEVIFEDGTVTARYARLILKDKTTGDRTMTAGLGKTPTLVIAGTYRVSFTSTEIGVLTDDFGNGSYAIAIEWEDSNGCTGTSDSADQSVGTPSCCLFPSSPTIARGSSTSQAVLTALIGCPTSSIRVQQIAVSVDNASGSQPERFNTVVLSGGTGTVSWTLNKTSETFDLTGSPYVINNGNNLVLTMNMNRDVRRDTITVTITYKIGGFTVVCTFSGIVS